MRRYKRLVVWGIKKDRGRPKKYWEVFIYGMSQLYIC